MRCMSVWVGFRQVVGARCLDGGADFMCLLSEQVEGSVVLMWIRLWAGWTDSDTAATRLMGLEVGRWQVGRRSLEDRDYCLVFGIHGCSSSTHWAY
jgi:hypothetical protein